LRTAPGLRSSLFDLWGCLLLAGILLPLTTTATSPHLAFISPTGGQRGTELELSFQGERLQDALEILGHEPGLQVLQFTSVVGGAVKAQVRIAPDCPLGEHHLRVRTATGLSELRTFLVGPFPVVEEKEPNNTPAQAQKVPLNTTVTGVVTSEDVDCFAVQARKGQRISAEVEGMRLGRGSFDPRLAVFQPDGSLLADIHDTWLGLQDPFVSFLAPQDGTYILQLREITYEGNDSCHYRLHVGTFPRPTAVYPPGGKTGETVALTWFSEATGLFTNMVKLPNAPTEKFGVFAELDGQTAPAPNWIRVCPFSNVLAAPPNQDRDHATATDLQPPLALNGIVSKPGQENWFRFPAAKGLALEVSVYARRLRSPLDSVVEVLDAKGQSLAANDDAAGPDSSLRFTPPETANYFVRLRDTLGQGGPDFFYRVEVTPVKPALALKIPAVARNDSQSRQFIVVPRGNRFATLISARRADFGGELVFSLQGLPPGVTLQAERMAANIDAQPLVFEAAPDAPIAARLLDLTAVWTNGGSRVTGSFRQDVELVPGPNNSTFYTTSVDQFCVAVTKEAPFKLRIVEPKVPLVQAGSMRLEIAAERWPGFDEPIEVQMLWNPPGVGSQSEATIPKGATNVFYQLNAAGDAETRTWKLAVLGHATVEGGALYVSSQLAPLEVAAPFLAGKIETLWLNPGNSGKLNVSLQNAKPFEGKAAIRLCGLPENVSAPEKQITKDDSEIAFDLTVDAKCPNGSYRNLFCAVDVKQNSQVIPHNIAFGGILRVMPPKKETK